VLIPKLGNLSKHVGKNKAKVTMKGVQKIEFYILRNFQHVNLMKLFL